MNYLCYCGAAEQPHNYRHAYRPTVRVRRQNNEFTIDAADYPDKIGLRCSVPQCRGAKSLHNTTIIPHDYAEEQYVYREIRMILPPDTICIKNKGDRICGLTLAEHKKELTHIFTTKVTVMNSTVEDKISILDPNDEDTKINWK